MSNTEIIEAQPEPILPVPVEDSEYKVTLDYVKRNQIDLIEKGNEGLVGLMAVAEASQHPRAYEVLSAYLKSLSEINKDLLGTAEKKRDLFKHQGGPVAPTVTNQNLFVGSTAELAELLKGK